MYYTIRELSDHADELWVLRSLGEEVLTRGKGGGTAWTNEHLEDYRACWHTPPNPNPHPKPDRDPTLNLTQP